MMAIIIIPNLVFQITIIIETILLCNDILYDIILFPSNIHLDNRCLKRKTESYKYIIILWRKQVE